MDGLMLASRAESMPNVVLESFAQSTPVIAADVGDVARLVRTGETGWLVPPEDVSALATAIGDFVSAPADQLTSMGWQGRQRVESEHSLAQLCERTLAVYQEVLRPRESESARSSGR
jgi:glycosyltransferase involved in cell wall biosynthesis